MNRSKGEWPKRKNIENYNVVQLAPLGISIWDIYPDINRLPLLYYWIIKKKKKLGLMSYLP